jgi:four helix bundle protein
MNIAKGFRDLDVFVLGKKLAVKIHQMTLLLPKHELYEEGSQIRRSSKSIVSCIVEGFARRRYKSEFFHYLTIAIGECDETQVHLELLYETGSLKEEDKYKYFSQEYHKLARMLNSFYNAIMKRRISEK